MIAFHSLWTKPSRNKFGSDNILEDYELLTMILSALKWREKNGSILMITDSIGKEFLVNNGLTELWNLGIKDDLDQVVDSFIDPYLFWAAGKLYSLKMMECPCVMLDTDLVIWEVLTDNFCDSIITAHEEELNSDVYPDLDKFYFKGNYSIPDTWDRCVKACNTAFLYMPEGNFCNYYVQSAIDFMKYVITDKLNAVNAMCTAEQRILPMCATEKGIEIDFLMDLNQANNQKIATHIWGYKRTLKYSYLERKKYCKACIDRIHNDFPEYEKLVMENKIFQHYL